MGSRKANEMQTTQEDLDFALKMYGQATLDHAKKQDSYTYDNMVFWQNQCWQCAKDIAAKETPTIY